MPSGNRGPSMAVRQQDRPVVERCLQQAMAIIPECEEIVIDTRLDAYVEIISRRVSTSRVRDRDMVRRIVRRALFRLRGYRQHSFRWLNSALRAEVRLAAGQPAPFNVLMLLNIRRESLVGFAPFHVLGHELRAPGWGELHGLQADEVWREAERSGLRGQHLREPQLLFEPIVCQTQARDVREAVVNAEFAFDTLRALLNFTELHGVAWHHLSGLPRPLAHLLPSPVLAVFDADDAFQRPLFRTPVSYRYARHQIEQDRVRQASELAAQLWPQSGQRDLRLLLTDAVRKYGQAMDTPDWQQAFLTLWQALEVVASPLQDANIGTNTVASRISRLLGEDRLLAEVAKCAGHTRNELVHLGRFSEYGLNQVNLLKLVVENVIDIVFAKIGDLPNIHSLENYHLQRPRNDTELKETHRAIDLIARQRGLDLERRLD